VKNASGAIVFGPAGEGIAPVSGTNSKEVFELEGNPTPSVTPTDQSSATGFGYDDGASESTFGLPNNWLDGTTPRTQRFTTLTAPEIDVSLGDTPVADDGGIDFGTIPTGGSSSISLTIANTGTANLTGIAASLSGTGSGSFSITTSPATQLAAPAGSTTVTVVFLPASQGAKTATLRITSNDDDENPYEITLTGNAASLLPEISVQQPAGSELVDGTAKRAFGTVKTGKAGLAKTFVIRNTGKAPLTSLSVTKAGTHAKDFIVTQPLKKTLAPGTSTTFKVTFKPTAAGVRNAALKIRNNDANENPFDIKISGLGAK
jgi:hypothetical protein